MGFPHQAESFIFEAGAGREGFGWRRGIEAGDGGGGGAAHPLDSKGPLTADDAARLMQRYPNHPVTKAFSKYFKKGYGAISQEEGKLIDSTLRRLPPFRPSQPLYRGISAPTDSARDALADSIREKHGFIMTNWINSGSTSPAIAKAFAAKEGHGVLLVAVKVDKSARNISPLVQALNPEMRHQEEIAFLRGSKFSVKAETKTQLRTGTSPAFLLEETP